MSAVPMMLVPMTRKRAEEIAGGPLGRPSKMPGTAWGISPEKCITGAKLALIEGSTCSRCYAAKGRHVWPSVTTAHARRAAALSNPQWRDAMLVLLKAEEAKVARLYHRWLDAGDLQSLQMLIDIAWIAEQMPRARFWLPTRERAIVLRYLRDIGPLPRNLVIRVSAAMIDGAPPAGFANTSTVHSAGKRPPAGRACPSPQQDGKCGDCRRCWDRRVKSVSYLEH